MKTTERIDVAGRHGPIPVDVIERRGVWVLHEGAVDPGERPMPWLYTVTHAPSGLGVLMRRPEHQARAALMVLGDRFAEWADSPEARRVDGPEIGALVSEAARKAEAEHRETRMSYLLRNASPEVWVAHTADTAGDGWPVCSTGNSQSDGEDWGVEVRGVPCSQMDGDARADALLIAALRNRVPVLLSRLSAIADSYGLIGTDAAEAMEDALRLFEEGEPQ